jgi:long-subunit acyl-CoA synthetase (AMP-forming)
LLGCTVSGQLIVLCRMKEVVFSNGKAINPNEIEKKLLRSIPKIDNVAVCPTTGNVRNENVSHPRLAFHFKIDFHFRSL